MTIFSYCKTLEKFPEENFLSFFNYIGLNTFENNFVLTLINKRKYQENFGMYMKNQISGFGRKNIISDENTVHSIDTDFTG